MKATEFSEMRQNNGHYAIQGHRFWSQSKAHMRLPISDTNLPLILHQVMAAEYRTNFP